MKNNELSSHLKILVQHTAEKQVLSEQKKYWFALSAENLEFLKQREMILKNIDKNFYGF